MSGIDYSEFVSGLDAAGESHGQVSGEPLPAAWYPFVVKKAEVVAAKSGLPVLKLQLGVTGDAPKGAANRVAFAQVMLGAKRTREERDMSGRVIETMKSEEDYQKDAALMKDRLNGFLVSVDAKKSTPTAPKDSLEFIGQTIGVAGMEGVTFMGRLKVDRSEQFGDRNSLEEYHHINDPKRGLAAWREGKWGLQKLTAVLAQAQGSGTTTATGLHTL